jgi:choline dehydrogenase-like flavoprotein
MDPIPLSYGDKLVKNQLDGRVIDGVKVTVRSTPQATATRNYNPYEGDAQLERFFDAKERPACQGNSNCIPLCPIGAKYDATVHLRAALKTERVALRTGYVVTQLVDDRHGRIREVRYKNWSGSNKGDEQRVTAKAVVLAANAIETPRLLQMSNLANRSGQVGRNLMDHLQDELTAFFPEALYPFRGPQSTCSIEDFRDGPFRAAHSAIRMTVGNDGHARTRSPLDMLDGYLDKGTFGEALRSALADDIPRMLRISYSTEVLPNPNNRITFSTKPDLYGLPRPQIRFEVDQYTYNGLKKAHEIALALLDGISDIKKDQTREREWQRKWSTAAHIMGTCRMGTDPMTSVVDPNGRAHDLEGAHVGCVQQLLGFVLGQPRTDPRAGGLDALHLADAVRQLGVDQVVVGGFLGQAADGRELLIHRRRRQLAVLEQMRSIALDGGLVETRPGQGRRTRPGSRAARGGT